jgi:TetR/AcrR family transcriptional regulator, regulator of mycofactocin system
VARWGGRWRERLDSPKGCGNVVAVSTTDSVSQRPGRPPGTSRREVTRTALELCAERGFEETTVDDIAEALGVSRRTLFRYFASKNDMVWGDFDWVLERLRRCLEATPGDVSLHEALGGAVVESNRYEDEQLPELRIRMRLITGVPALQAHSALRYAEWREVIAEWVAARLDCGVADLIPQTVAHAALGTSMAAFLVWVDDPSSDLVANLEAGYALLGQGVSALESLARSQ